MLCTWQITSDYFSIIETLEHHTSKKKNNKKDKSKKYSSDL